MRKNLTRAITFTFHDIQKFNLNELEYGSFLATIFVEENVLLSEVSYIFCSDDYLHAINKEFLGHDTFTDILTFTLSDPGQPVISEIYISIERVEENAEKFSTGFNEEVKRVMIHGILHLCGYSDHTPMLKAEMTKMEDRYLEKFSST